MTSLEQRVQEIASIFLQMKDAMMWTSEIEDEGLLRVAKYVEQEIKRARIEELKELLPKHDTNYIPKTKIEKRIKQLESEAGQ